MIYLAREVAQLNEWLAHPDNPLAQATAVTNERNALLFLAASAEDDNAGGEAMQRVAAAIGLSRAAMTACADRLERRELLRRQPDPMDRRITRLTITDRGLELVREGLAFVPDAAAA